MVEHQLRARGIRDERVLAAMAELPREIFLPLELEEDAYDDTALPIAAGQTISQPFIVALMTELLEPNPGMRVLEVGTGSGYQAAVLGRLGCDVLSIERQPELAAAARARLASLGLADRVRIEVADGSVGWRLGAPFEGILVTAAAPRVPDPLRRQLADGGRLVIPVGPLSGQELLQVIRRREGFEERTFGGCVFVPLVGAAAYDEETVIRARRRWLGSWRGQRP
ncbi:MAG: protein-L-isoaspartate(D-aspartate) O-methyltransferase [Candidatus Limnocylindrales bacterium]|jgi:protein-L-isoaspartate(D-aspartate) O-methyltransferase